MVTGSTPFITVPVMFQLGMEPRTALATNMLALTFMSVGGALPFIKARAIDRHRMPSLVALTIAGSVIGALLVLIIPAKVMPLVVAIAVPGVAVFSITDRKVGVREAAGEPSRAAVVAGYV